jgi:hypothetical protein
MLRSSLLNPIRNSAVAISGALPLITALGLALATPAPAHVKWFAPYIVQAAPQSVAVTLTDPWFWLGIALVAFFLLLTLAEGRKEPPHLSQPIASTLITRIQRRSERRG